MTVLLKLTFAMTFNNNKKQINVNLKRKNADDKKYLGVFF